MTQATAFDYFKRQLNEPLEPILHASTARLNVTGWFLLIGYPLFGTIWHFLQPQVFDGPWLRLGFAATGLPLILQRVNRFPTKKSTEQIASVAYWIGLPFAFSWMYITNGGNPEWFTSVCCMVLIYYHLTDWRLATVGTIAGMCAAFLLHRLAHSWLPATPTPPYGQHAALLGFCWSAAIFIGSSSANLRREGVRKTRETLSIIAHELRTPLAATELLAKVLQGQAAAIRKHGDALERNAGDLEEIGQRISTSARTMNQRINALLLNSSDSVRSAEQARLRASDLIRGALDKFPFPFGVRRDVALLEIKEDFAFMAPEALMVHVIDNLLSNATMALIVKDEAIVFGDLLISISVDHASRSGIVRIIDKGAGMDKKVLDQIFEPFITANPEMRLGLGLAFCEQVINASGGKIGVESSREYGTCVTLTLPLGKSVNGAA